MAQQWHQGGHAVDQPQRCDGEIPHLKAALSTGGSTLLFGAAIPQLRAHVEIAAGLALDCVIPPVA